MAALYKRGNIYWTKFQYRNQPIRRSLETTSRPQALINQKKVEEEVKSGTWGNMPKHSYSETMISFMTNHSQHLAANSHKRYIISAKFLHPHFEGMALEDITSARLADFEAARRLDNVTGSTIRRDLSCLSSMFTHAQIDLEWIDHNPVPLFLKRQDRRGRLKEGKPRRRYLSLEEEQKLLKNALGDLPGAIAFAVDTGLRLEEQLSLAWPQVDFDKTQVTVIGKGGKTRTVPLLPRAIETLSSLPRLFDAEGNSFVFCKQNGERYRKRTRGLANAVRRAKITHIQWHDLRRTCGCRLLQEHGLTMQEVSLWLGHGSIGQTERTYAFLEADQLHKALEKD